MHVIFISLQISLNINLVCFINSGLRTAYNNLACRGLGCSLTKIWSWMQKWLIRY